MKNVFFCLANTWLTPPEVIKAHGPFTTDPCCPPNMPWQTAKYMWTGEENGLLTPWRGRVFMNNPYSKPLPYEREEAGAVGRA